MSFMLHSASFVAHGMISSRLTSDGQYLFAPLVGNGMLAGTKDSVLNVDDPDAPDLQQPTKALIEKAMQAHILGGAERAGSGERRR